MKDLIAAFPLGFVATVRADGGPAVSPKGTFLVLDDRRLAFADIRSPQTRANLTADPRVEVNFIDPFRRKAVRVAGKAAVHLKGTGSFSDMLPRWQTAFGDLARRIGALVEIDIAAASEIRTPPYDDGVTEDEMIALYKDKYGKVFP
ncbi:pyridoxamine 5'-phosphate oxidase family protein [Yoonia sp.]|uniref:pyridoxamine 5'-phosphate oxidase family protein n=1 Tax=Yoonia sp. TaxID=2212373 RepID=UPI002FD88EBB